MKPYVSHRKFMVDKLRKNRELALGYLHECLKDDDFGVFLLAVRYVVEAYGGVMQLSQKTGLNRQHLYKVLSDDGNPEIGTLGLILDALGFRLSVEQKQKVRKAS